jgi:hypothetical protein
MYRNAVFYQVTREGVGNWNIRRNTHLVLAWQHLFGAVDIATALAEFEAVRSEAPVKVIWDERGVF